MTALLRTAGKRRRTALHLCQKPVSSKSSFRKCDSVLLKNGHNTHNCRVSSSLQGISKPEVIHWGV